MSKLRLGLTLCCSRGSLVISRGLSVEAERLGN